MEEGRKGEGRKGEGRKGEGREGGREDGKGSVTNKLRNKQIEGE